MRVEELAQDLKVDGDVLLQLLRGMGIHVASLDDAMTDADVALVLAKVERARRSGKANARAALEAAVEESSTPTRRRRRRRVTDEAEPEAEVEEQPDEPEAEAEAAAEEIGTEVVAESEEVEVGDAEAPEAESTDEAPVEEVQAEAEPEPAEEVEPMAVAEVEEPESGELETAPAAGVRAGPAPTPVRDVAGRPEPVRKFRRPVPAAQGGPVGPAASAGPGGTVRIQAEGYTADGQRKRKDKKKRRVDQDEVQENLQRVMAQMKAGGKKKRKKSSRPSREELELQEMELEEERERERKTVRVNEFLTVAELAELVDESPTEIVGSAFKNLGLMVTINQRLDFDQIELLLDEFGYTAVREEEYEALAPVEEEDEALLQPRPPVVTVMGHVDHGKTLLLDRIRNTNVVAGESGGITQHIGAYHVQLPDGRAISFLDTPGHAAFTAMRARGADLTDVVILIVAADDSVMPQTVEAISHAKNANVPMVVAINKVDLPAANVMKVKQELLQHDVQVEDFGGDVLCAEVSAKTGQGIDDLLEKVLLQAEMLELRANPDRSAQGVVVEAQLDVGKGPVVTAMIQKGTLQVGDSFVCGLYDGRVRALLDERGNHVDEVGPGVPVQVLGAAGVPQAGDTFQAMDADEAAEIATSRQRLDREKQLRIRDRGRKLGDFAHMVAAGEVSRLPLIIKGDVDGSVQAVADALEQLSTPEVEVEVVHRAVGAVNESDVLLAQTTEAVIIAFRVRPDAKARQLAEDAGVEIKTYEVIYNAVDDIRASLEGMLTPEERENLLGAAEVREVFKITRVGTIAGCYVTEGIIDRKARARVIRDGIVVYNGDFASLKRFKDDVKEVREGFECGIGIQNYNDVKVGDIIECYRVEEIARTLAESAETRV